MKQQYMALYNAEVYAGRSYFLPLKAYQLNLIFINP